MNKPLKLLASLVIAYSAAAIGGLATASAISTWYDTLNKPAFNPPNWIFGPVWTVLYALMGVGLWLVWTKTTDKPKKLAYIAFGTQLALNTLWSLVFFGLQMPWLGVVVIVALLAAMWWMFAEFMKISPLAAYLQVPYILWVSFATLLNVSIAVLN